MKKQLILSFTLAVLAAPSVFAQVNQRGNCDYRDIDCDLNPNYRPKPLKHVYPYKPFPTSKIKERAAFMTENENYVGNIFDLDKMTILHRNTKVQPWGGHFWSLNKGMVAVNYHDPRAPWKEVFWQFNAKDFEKRTQKVHSRVFELSQEDINHLSPTEKYDILLGDENFDLTNRIWNYSKKVGEEDKYAFLSAIDMPPGYRLPKVGTFMALWEGICHGWAIASGHSPRPEKTVNITMPNGKNLPFYPDDLKALTSLMWAHNIVQNKVRFEGGRCNKKQPPRDDFGRYIDVDSTSTDIGPEQTEVQPNCADVHPAIFHISLMNITGIEGRSFVIDHNPEAPVANQPVSGYSFRYFNPITGKEGNLKDSMMSRVQMAGKDKFRYMRNQEATHVVGIAMNLKYVNWNMPTRKPTDSIREDKIAEQKFNYDLELDSRGNIVGGQWRVQKNGSAGVFGQGTNQPDFFWVAPRNWKEDFKGDLPLPEWNPEYQAMPPMEYKQSTPYYHTAINKWTSTCRVEDEHGNNPDLRVPCTFTDPKPQPLINVVQKLLEMAQN